MQVALQPRVEETKPLPLQRVICTEQITLRPINVCCAEEIHYRYTQNVAKDLFAQQCKTPIETFYRIHVTRKQMLLGLQSAFTVHDNNDSSAFLGCAVLLHQKVSPRPVFWVREDKQHQGFGTQIFAALKKYAQEFLSFEFMIAKATEENKWGRRILEKQGAKVQGYVTLKENESGVENRILSYRLYL